MIRVTVYTDDGQYGTACDEKAVTIPEALELCAGALLAAGFRFDGYLELVPFPSDVKEAANGN